MKGLIISIVLGLPIAILLITIFGIIYGVLKDGILWLLN